MSPDGQAVAHRYILGWIEHHPSPWPFEDKAKSFLKIKRLDLGLAK
jgi:hypothetical protein